VELNTFEETARSGLLGEMWSRYLMNLCSKGDKQSRDSC